MICFSPLVYLVLLGVMIVFPTTAIPAIRSDVTEIITKQKNTAVDCPPAAKYGPGPPSICEQMADPNKLPAHPAESWFTKKQFNDLFPKSNIGWGPTQCQPYSYEAFRIAMRYFPRFANEKGLKNGYSDKENWRRDLAAFFAHAIQETGENDAHLYTTLDKVQADACFYRGGFYNWFEGGPKSAFLPADQPGFTPEDGNSCNAAGRYCVSTPLLDYFYKCGANETSACYFGRGAIQLSYNYNYGQFQRWLHERGVQVDLLNQPNLIITSRSPPLAILASLWFYMTPQPPKPAMHDIVMGNWHAGSVNEAQGYTGPIFGPTSLVINNECGGEDAADPGGPGESRRIKAFKWFCGYFKVPSGEQRTLSCKQMPQKLAQIKQSVSWQPDWSTTWKEQPCDCAPATYGGQIPYFQDGFYPQKFVEMNGPNRRRCVTALYAEPDLFGIGGNACLNHPVNETMSS